MSHNALKNMDNLAFFYDFPSPVAIKTCEDVYSFVNPVFCQWMGYEGSKAMLGKTDRQLFDGEFAEFMTQYDQQLLKRKITKNFTTTLIFPNEIKRTVSLFKTSIVDKSGTVLGIFTMIQPALDQIQELETRIAKTEKERDLLQGIIRKLPGSVYWKDRDGVYLGCNDYVALMAGVPSIDDVIGKNDYEFHWRNVADTVRKDEREIMETGIAKELEIKGPSVDGRPSVFLATKYPLKDDSGNIVGIVCTSLDVTEWKKAEEQLKEAKIKQKLQEDRIKVLQSIGASIAHELRTPLGAIHGACAVKSQLGILTEGYKLAQEAGLPVTSIQPYVLNIINESFNNIKNVTIRANNFINMLLAYIKSQANLGKAHAQELCDFSMLSINQCLENIFSQYPFKEESDRALIHWDQSIDFNFKGDFALFEHVVFNLLKNAIYYIKAARKGVITVRCKQGNMFNKLYFKDTGLGIKKDVLPKIFEDFYSTRNDGTGIGLAYCKWAMKMMQGRIECHSQWGEFTEFILTFPKCLPNMACLKLDGKSD